MGIDQSLQQQFALLALHLDEKQRRLMAAANVQILGQGGVSRAARLSDFSRQTIYKRIAELGKGDDPVVPSHSCQPLPSTGITLLPRYYEMVRLSERHL